MGVETVVTLLLLAHIGTTLFMVGLIWFVQIVHYPLFDRVGIQAFDTYESHHTRLTGWVVAPPMLLELLTALLLIWFRPATIPAFVVWLGLTLLAVIWLSTAFIQVPLHNSLSLGFDPKAYRKLVKSNWLRTVAWSARGLLVLGMVAGLMG